MSTVLDVRPFQLMCLVCRQGALGATPYLQAGRLDRILASFRAHPQRPLRLRCNVSGVYAWQNPGTREDTPEGALFNVRRDLHVLYQLGLVPGDTRPARELVERVYEKIATAAGTCGFATTTGGAWQGCGLAGSGNYERGRAQGWTALIPARDAADKARAKQDSVALMQSAARLRIRPHHLLCMACFQSGREHPAPIAEDNLAEAIAIIQQRPEIPVELVPGPCMICPPCSACDTARNLCVGGHGMGLRDEKKDLDVLQRLGLEYGAVAPARDLYRLIFERISSTQEICGHNTGVVTGYEWTICGNSPDGNPGYLKARQAALHIPGLERIERI